MTGSAFRGALGAGREKLTLLGGCRGSRGRLMWVRAGMRAWDGADVEVEEAEEAEEARGRVGHG